MRDNATTLPYLLRLLDDEQPDVRREVSAQLANFGGDLSDQIAGLGVDLSREDREILSTLLLPARRAALREAWFTPSRALLQPDGDWELFEAFLRMISDYLHDGVSLRPSLSDMLDELAEESTDLELNDPIPLASWLFESGKLKPNKEDYYNPRNSDLAAVLENGAGNPLSLSLILTLVAQRRKIPIYGCNYPGHFLCWTDTSSGPLVIDPYNKARTLAVKQIIANNPGISATSREALATPARQVDMLRRVLSNLAHAFTKNGSEEDLALVTELTDSLDELDISLV
ncbi:transglutaminase-like domain-containing protein [Roseibacillus ishigakijimensis]|uniref:Transglutaminase family protein n=1 Tax=Roseibacillus ishigakijimensis TaxID=454146 RepID=A0A934RSV4_9BACT|nr:transglutaminase-like domain-containing protein [Roseibacillus ishigakijimensis]MBK1834429.1 transglutaminase family protein [Roseibacillus ishigakijimensis]